MTRSPSRIGCNREGCSRDDLQCSLLGYIPAIIFYINERAKHLLDIVVCPKTRLCQGCRLQDWNMGQKRIYKTIGSRVFEERQNGPRIFLYISFIFTILTGGLCELLSRICSSALLTSVVISSSPAQWTENKFECVYVGNTMTAIPLHPINRRETEIRGSRLYPPVRDYKLGLWSWSIVMEPYVYMYIYGKVKVLSLGWSRN